MVTVLAINKYFKIIYLVHFFSLNDVKTGLKDCLEAYINSMDESEFCYKRVDVQVFPGPSVVGKAVVVNVWQDLGKENEDFPLYLYVFPQSIHRVYEVD